MLVVEGSIPNEKISSDGYWAAFGTDPKTGQPIRTTEWIDRLAPKALAVVGAGTCATYGGIHAMEGNPTGCMGLQDYLGLGLEIEGRAARSSTSRAARCSPTISWRRLLYLLCQLAGLAPMIPLDDAAADQWLFGKTVHEGCDRAGYYEQAISRSEYGSPKCIVKTRLLGSGRAVQRAQTRLDGRHRRLPQRRRHLHRLHDAGLPRQVHAVHGRAAGRDACRRL